MKDISSRLVVVVNQVREVGLLITEDWDKLPGKQMTIDFWEKQQDLYVDQYGNRISWENLKWCVKVANMEKNEITDVRHANSYEKGLLSLIGYSLEGEAPGAASSEIGNQFIALTNGLEKLGRQVTMAVSSLNTDVTFGPIEQWPAERMEITMTKIEPVFDTLKAMIEKMSGELAKRPTFYPLERLARESAVYAQFMAGQTNLGPVEEWSPDQIETALRHVKIVEDLARKFNDQLSFRLKGAYGAAMAKAADQTPVVEV